MTADSRFGGAGAWGRRDPVMRRDKKQTAMGGTAAASAALAVGGYGAAKYSAGRVRNAPGVDEAARAAVDTKNRIHLRQIRGDIGHNNAAREQADNAARAARDASETAAMRSRTLMARFKDRGRPTMQIPVTEDRIGPRTGRIIKPSNRDPQKPNAKTISVYREHKALADLGPDEAAQYGRDVRGAAAAHRLEAIRAAQQERTHIYSRNQAADAVRTARRAERNFVPEPHPAPTAPKVIARYGRAGRAGKIALGVGAVGAAASLIGIEHGRKKQYQPAWGSAAAVGRKPKAAPKAIAAPDLEHDRRQAYLNGAQDRPKVNTGDVYRQASVLGASSLTAQNRQLRENKRQADIKAAEAEGNKYRKMSW